MAEQQTEKIYAGTPVCGDIAIGHLAVVPHAKPGLRPPGNPAQERALLTQALSCAQAGLKKLIAGTSELAGEILEFQLALLDDDDLIDPIFRHIENGSSADVAWSRMLEGEIAEYRSGSDDYMSARADDLVDLQQRVLNAISGDAVTISYATDGAILVAEDLTPSAFLEHNWQRLAGAAIIGGSPTSHVAILAQAQNVNLLVGLKARLSDLDDGTPAIINASGGTLVANPGAAAVKNAKTQVTAAIAARKRARLYVDKPAVTADGVAVDIHLNVDDPALLKTLSPRICDGIGLTRTEFLFAGTSLPDEDQQFDVYKEIITWADGRPVTLRTLDAGGDKPIAGVTVDDESNPFLGLRGVRLSLLHPKILCTQLRAMVRASAWGPVKILVPMVTKPEEFNRVRAYLNQVVDDLGANNAPQLGMMVEVPAAALNALNFAADFYSIGSNDLIQYTNAAARDNPALSWLNDPPGPAVFELIRLTVTAAARRNVNVSLCGDMASSTHHIAALLDTGLRTLSVAPGQIGRVKQAISQHDCGQGEDNGRLS